MASRFKGRRALVTGGSRGLGRAIAARLLEEGALVLIVGRSPQHLQQAHEDLAPLAPPNRIWEYAALIDSDHEVHRQIVAFAEQCMGGVDFLINAAGGAYIGRALEASWGEWQREIDTKFWGYFGMMRAAAPCLQHNPAGGVMINVVGIAGKDPNPLLPMASAGNAALRALSKILATELAPFRIRVVNVHPGASETHLLHEMAAGYARLGQQSVAEALGSMRAGNPLGRLPRPAEIAELVLFLLSDAAEMITGTAIDIDGGSHHGLA